VDILLTGDSIAFAADSFRVALQFTDTIQVVYRAKKMPQMGIAVVFSRSANNSMPATSEMYMRSKQPVFVLMDGTFYEGTDIMFIGFFAWWEKMCNKLPYNYWPPPKLPKK
jgi:hypothetical protein